MSEHRKHFDRAEEEVIKRNYMYKTDEELAAMLGRSPRAIKLKRKRMELAKSQGRRKKAITKEMILKSAADPNLSHLEKDDRIELFKANFHRNPRYSRLCKELEEDDLEFYKHKYVEFLDSVDTITPQEEDMLHHLIMEDIHLSHIRQQIKDEQQKAKDGEGIFPIALYSELKSVQDRLIKYQQSLRVTRDQRLEKDKEEKITIVSLVKSFQDKKNKEEAGRQASVMSYYTDKCKDEMLTWRYLMQ
jgi:hypothetical protein